MKSAIKAISNRLKSLLSTGVQIVRRGAKRRD